MDGEHGAVEALRLRVAAHYEKERGPPRSHVGYLAPVGCDVWAPARNANSANMTKPVCTVTSFENAREALVVLETVPWRRLPDDKPAQLRVATFFE
jgi:hypothetical protein